MISGQWSVLGVPCTPINGGYMPALCLWETQALACADATLWINNGIICREKLERRPINMTYLEQRKKYFGEVLYM